MLRLLCFLTVILSVRSGSAPFIQPCKNGDNVCILASARAALSIVVAGIPELGVDSLEPMRLAEIKGSKAGLELTFTDTVVTGMKDCTLEAIKHDVKSKQYVTIRCSNDLHGNYVLNGQLLIFPIKGEGKYHIKIRDIVIKTVTDIETVQGADGKPHWHIKNRKHSYHVNTSAAFHFDNLFNGNKVLAQPVEEFVNSNWREVMDELAPPIVKAVVDRVTDTVEQLYKAIPVDEMFLE